MNFDDFCSVSAESILAQTFFLVEASSFEQHALWMDHAEESSSCRYTALKWKRVNPGKMVTVGMLHDRPVCITIQWEVIEGQLIGFWEATSQLVDYVMIEKWFDTYFTATYARGRRARTDSNNFGHCLSAIHDAVKPRPASAAVAP